ncbi:MAG: response regulator [Candidatus Omnitrophica bacterium]|nr:response regulator [Candidatus Omnitrophota bacterium]
MARVLIVDDEKMICEEFRDLLTDEGHQVDIAMSGLTALELYAQQTYAVVFLDVLMPRMEGREVFEAMKKIRDTVPIVIMSGYIPANKEADILQMGAMSCLRKPLDLDRVRDIIRLVSSK